MALLCDSSNKALQGNDTFEVRFLDNFKNINEYPIYLYVAAHSSAKWEVNSAVHILHSSQLKTGAFWTGDPELISSLSLVPNRTTGCWHISQEISLCVIFSIQFTIVFPEKMTTCREVFLLPFLFHRCNAYRSDLNHPDHPADYFNQSHKAHNLLSKDKIMPMSHTYLTRK